MTIPRIWAPLLLIQSLLPGQSAEIGEELRARSLAMLQEALQSRNSYELLKGLVDTAPGRLAGTAAAGAAVEWAEENMRAIGLKNVRRQPVLVPRWVRGEVCEIAIRSSGDGSPEALSALALGGSAGTGGRALSGRVVEVNSFGQLRALGEDAVKGRIVFFNHPFDLKLRNTFAGYSATVPARSRGAVEAAQLGAVAVVIRSVTTASDDHPHTGAMRYQRGVRQIPAAALSVAAAERLSRALSERPDLELSIRLDCHTLEPVECANVIGEIPGREKPDQIVLIGAHLDSWDVGQGAHDDGAGVAHCLEAARLILESGAPPRRTVRVVLFANEENGLAGGRAYADMPQDQLDSHILAIETDSGGFAPRGFGVKGGQPMVEAFGTLDQLLRIYDLGQVVQGGGGADISFLEPAGVPVMGLRVEDHRYFDLHHSIKDHIREVHPRELALGAAALAVAAFSVADSGGVPPRLPSAGR